MPPIALPSETPLVLSGRPGDYWSSCCRRSGFAVVRTISVVSFQREERLDRADRHGGRRAVSADDAARVHHQPLWPLAVQFSIRSLLVLVVAASTASSWLAVEMKWAKQQKETVEAIRKWGGGGLIYDWEAVGSELAASIILA